MVFIDSEIAIYKKRKIRKLCSIQNKSHFGKLCSLLAKLVWDQQL